MKLTLSDFERWRSCNAGQEFSLFDYAHGVLNQHRVSADLVVAFARMFWPEFVEVDGSVFVRALYSPSRLRELRQQHRTRADVEFWMNLLCVDGFVDGLEHATLEHAEAVAEVLVASWRAKLGGEFPARRFAVDIVKDLDAGDVCVVLTEGRKP